MLRLHVPSFLALLLALAGCDSGGGAPDGGGGGVDSGTPPGTDGGPPGDVDSGPVGSVTYYGDVRPILVENCTHCHVAGGIGPFPLDTYEVAAPVATLIAAATRDRIMPPYLADNSGDCQTFRDARWLTDREIAVLTAWDEQGEPMGDPTTPAPTPPVLPTLTGAVTTLDIGVDYAPDTSGPDDYRCFVVDNPASGDVYLTGYDVHPGNSAMVHHVIVYAPTSASAGNEARDLDAAEAGPGYTCFGAAEVAAQPVVLWAPGTGATFYPEGTGIRHPTGVPYVVQIHYNTLAATGTDRTRVDIQSVASGVTNARLLPLGDYDMALAPRMSSVTTTEVLDLASIGRGFDVPLTIYGHFPHMHTLGRALRVEHTPDMSSTAACLIDVPRWDFNWQLAYWYETPLEISSLDSVSISCTYDTTSRTDTVTWGEGTQDEMCLNFFYTVVAGGL